MASLAELERSLLAILSQLRPYLADIVVVGGWVPHLYRRFGGFRLWGADLSLTGDVDALVAPQVATGDRQPIATILDQAGFRPIVGAPVAAVWAKKPEEGEKIEFLVDHAGPWRTRGEIRAVADQPGLGAIALEGLWFLRAHATSLEVPVRGVGVQTDPLNVRLPRLGAYAINKAATFSLRLNRHEGGNPKRAKDLLYIRDLMAAGDEVVERIATDVPDLLNVDERSRQYIRRAASNVGLLVGGTWGDEVIQAAAMLVERTPTVSREAAIADIRGHITDLRDLLKESGV